jgi:hypothetical protein
MSKEEEERSELNTQQRRVGLPPPAGLRLEGVQRPLTQTCSVTMAAALPREPPRAHAVTQRDEKEYPATALPRRATSASRSGEAPRRPAVPIADDVDAAARPSPPRHVRASHSRPPVAGNLAVTMPMEARALQPLSEHHVSPRLETDNHSVRACGGCD